MNRIFALLFSSLALFIVVPGCSSDEGTGSSSGRSDVGSIVVGVTSDLRIGVDIDRLRVVMRVAGEVIRESVFTTSSEASPLKLPAEFSFNDLSDGESVAIEIDAFRIGDSTKPLVTRIASTTIIAGQTRLLRLQIDSRCAVIAPGVGAPECLTPETCIAGVCRPSSVDVTGLLPYSPSWSQTSNDICKPVNGGLPVVIVGEGQADFLPLNNFDVTQIESGPQGGHHIWVALRLKNLLRSGSITAVTGYFPNLGLAINAFQVIFTFEQDEGGYCKLYGLRFQVDQNANIYDLLGHVLEVTVTVTDKDGTIGIGKRTVTLSSDIL